MATKTFYFYDTSVNGFGKLDEGSVPALTTASALYGLVPSPGYQTIFQYNGTVIMPTMDNGGLVQPSSLLGNALRTALPLTGTFAAGIWTFTSNLVAGDNKNGVAYGLLWTLWKGTSPNGSNSTQLTVTSGANNEIGYSLTPIDQTSNTVPYNPPALVFNNEYLFVQLYWDFNTNDPNYVLYQMWLRTGTTRLDTTDFGQGPQVYNVSLDEPLVKPWGYSNLTWGSLNLLWGRGLSESYAAGVVVSKSLTETLNASDSVVGSIQMSYALSESVTPTDTYIPNLVISKSLTESVTASDIVVGGMLYSSLLTESPSLLWGQSGLLWGATGQWGRSLAESFSAQQVFVNALQEVVTASDNYTATAVYTSTLTESVTALDAYSAGFIITASLVESVSALDAVVAHVSFNTILSELLASYWGTPGILWGASTGVWGGGAQDSVSAHQVFTCNLTESGIARDNVVASQIFITALTEAVNPIDMYVPNLVISVNLLEAGGAVDTVSASQIFRNFLVEAVSARDFLSVETFGSIEYPVLPPTVEFFGVEAIEDALGVDVWSFPDYDPLGTLVTGFIALGQRLARRLTNSRGRWYWSPFEGTDTREYLNELFTLERLAVIQNEIEREVLREEAVKTVSSHIVFDPQTSVMTIDLNVVTREGPFKYVLKITSTSLEIIWH